MHREGGGLPLQHDAVGPVLQVHQVLLGEDPARPAEDHNIPQQMRRAGDRRPFEYDQHRLCLGHLRRPVHALRRDPRALLDQAHAHLRDGRDAAHGQRRRNGPTLRRQITMQCASQRTNDVSGRQEESG